MKLHLACGGNILHGWSNMDLEPRHPDVLQQDLTQPLNLPDNSVDVIYSEHFIEHIPKAAAYAFIAECFKKLKPGATIRLSTPNLERIIRQYSYGKTDAWHNMGWQPASKCDLLNEAGRLWGHEYLYDWHEMEKMLRVHGFVNIKRVMWGQSEVEALRNIESRPDNGEIVVEATKPLATQAKPKVSVVMASYNHEPYVADAINSVLAQTFQDFEFVITDDGSSDGTARVIEGFSDPRIKFNPLPKNKGACFATNDAIGRAQGQYIAILNSDDEFLLDKLQKQVDFLDANPSIGAVFAYPEMMNQHGVTFAPQDQAQHNGIFIEHNRTQVEWLQRLFHFNCLCHPTIMIRKSVYNEVGLYNPSLRVLPDYEMWVKVTQKTNIHIMEEPLIRMRRFDSETNESGHRPEVMRRVRWEHIKVIKRFLSTPDYLWNAMIQGKFSLTERPQLVSYKRELEFAALCAHHNTPSHLMAAIEVLSSINDESDETATVVYRVLNELTAQSDYTIGIHKPFATILTEQP
jgi:glycosyltransferase involved in cell wall biosynthesis/predicted SAM-dependent methyltransferase